jgi:hypothetical protein
MPVFLAAVFNLIFLVFLALTSSTPINATCTPSLFFQPNLVVAKIINQAIDNDSNNQINSFHKILGIKGKFTPNFYLIVPQNNNGCPTCSIPPSLNLNDIYLISVDPLSNSSEFQLAQCDRIISRISGLTDPKLYFQLLRVVTQPVWSAVFLLAILISSWLDNFFPSVIAMAISILIMLEVFGWSVVFLVRHLRSS